MDRLLRTLLFVPANSWRMITTAATEGEDAVILDLEDACPLGEKETGRILARDSVQPLKKQGIEVFVRINAFETGLTEADVNYVVVEGLDGVMLPKAESKADISTLAKLLLEEERAKGLKENTVAIIPLLETPKSIINVHQIISASKRVISVSFGAGDYSREIGAGMGVTRLSPDEISTMVFHPRCSIALAARAAGILAIDSPFFGLIIDDKGLVEEAKKSKLLGFTGKMITHPSHIKPINQVFSPSEGDVNFARQVKVAYEEANAKGLGATTIGGRMIDYGSYRRAINLLAIAKHIAEKKRETSSI